MNIPFDISPLTPGNVVDFDIRDENGVKVAYLTYKDAHCTFTPIAWNVRLPLSTADMPYRCTRCGNRYMSPDVSQCRVCGGAVRSIASAEGEKQDKPKLWLRYYEKINCKDKLTTIGGRACLVLGTAEAVIKTETSSSKVHRVILLSFYDFYQPTASEKYNILQYFYYDTSTGRMFIDPKLNELNKLLWTETTEHNFAIVPQWNVAKICEIYMNRSV